MAGCYCWAARGGIAHTKICKSPSFGLSSGGPRCWMKVFFAVHKLALLVCSRQRGVCRGAICPAMSSNVGRTAPHPPDPDWRAIAQSNARAIGRDSGFGDVVIWRKLSQHGPPLHLLDQCGGSLSSSPSCVDGRKVFNLIWALPDLTLFQYALGGILSCHLPINNG
jgi:hypothetical protein